MRTHRSPAFDLEIADPIYRKIVPRTLTGIMELPMVLARRPLYPLAPADGRGVAQ